MRESGERQKNGRKILAGALLLLAVMGLLFWIGQRFGAKPAEGEKSVTLEVVDDEGRSEIYRLETEAEYLEEVMRELEPQGLTFSGTEGQYGLMVDTVNGVKASFEKNGSYWSFYVNGDYCNYGISDQPVMDKDAFKIEYTVGK